MAQGIYVRPEIHELFGELTPSTEEVVQVSRSVLMWNASISDFLELVLAFDKAKIIQKIDWNY